MPNARKDGRRDFDSGEPVCKVFVLFQRSERRFLIVARMNCEVGALGGNPIGNVSRNQNAELPDFEGATLPGTVLVQTLEKTGTPP
jgi:hypothetical protein